MCSPRLKNVDTKIALGQLILRKIIKTVATRCQILHFKAKMHQNPKLGWGSAPDPAGGTYRAPQTPYLDLRGPISKGEGGEGVEGMGGEENGGEGRECCGVQKILKIDLGLPSPHQ